MRYGEGGGINWNLDGSDAPIKNAVLKKMDKINVSSGSGGQLSGPKEPSTQEDGVSGNFEDEFDADEEEAMVQAAMEIEKEEGEKEKRKEGHK